MEIFDFYKTVGIDMNENNGSKFYALKPSNALEVIDILKDEEVLIHSVDALFCDNQGHYDYKNENGERICWDMDSENIPDSDRYNLLKTRIQSVNDINILYLFSDEKSFKAWKKNHSLV
ncbi:hypothetical protein [Sulfurimonas sp.]|uniref:hypothetical protein n=1 Tax=Sulfurimonas sp. TaxID=2022749 RepID=UPI003D1023C0